MLKEKWCNQTELLRFRVYLACYQTVFQILLCGWRQHKKNIDQIIFTLCKAEELNVHEQADGIVEILVAY